MKALFESRIVYISSFNLVGADRAASLFLSFFFAADLPPPPPLLLPTLNFLQRVHSPVGCILRINQCWSYTEGVHDLRAISADNLQGKPPLILHLVLPVAG